MREASTAPDSEPEEAPVWLQQEWLKQNASAVIDVATEVTEQVELQIKESVIPSEPSVTDPAEDVKLGISVQSWVMALLCGCLVLYCVGAINKRRAKMEKQKYWSRQIQHFDSFWKTVDRLKQAELEDLVPGISERLKAERLKLVAKAKQDGVLIDCSHVPHSG